MNTKLRCLLLDDELPGLTYLKMLCEQIPELEVVRAFNSPSQFLSEMVSIDFDLCILDIEMPEMNGLQVANLLKGKPVIFTTAYSDYAAEAFDIDAIDYVRKPIKKERLQQAVTKAIAKLSGNHNEKQFIQLNTEKGKTLIFFDQLLYIKIALNDSRDKIAYMMDGTVHILKNVSFDKLLHLLPTKLFTRVNKQEVIAMKVVQVFGYDEIMIGVKDENGQQIKITLSETYRNDFLAKVNF
ncbi:MAG TPA: response regulator [Saprospiraceae bacterium]|nr:response regulator [Saprospiraceae bacterium]